MTELLSNEEFKAFVRRLSAAGFFSEADTASDERTARQGAEDEARRVFKIAMEADRRTVEAEAKLAAAEVEIVRLREALTKCRERFVEYRDAHMAKGTKDGQTKALRNAAMVEICSHALAGIATAAILNPSEKA